MVKEVLPPDELMPRVLAYAEDMARALRAERHGGDQAADL